MKVVAYSNFSKKIIKNKMKSSSSMRIGRFHPPKYRGKFKKLKRKLSKSFSQTSFFFLG
jgi:hypothetical protein